MSGPRTEDLAYQVWKDGYADGFADGWDRGIDRVILRLRGRVPAGLLAELGELAASPEQTTSTGA